MGPRARPILAPGGCSDELLGTCEGAADRRSILLARKRAGIPLGLESTYPVPGQLPHLD